MERSNGAVKTAFDIKVDGKPGPRQLRERDCREWKLSAINHDRRTWRSGVRSAMRAASQLSGRGPTDVDVADYDYDMMILFAILLLIFDYTAICNNGRV